MNKAPLGVWLSIVACLAASLVSLSARHKMEASNRAVGVMMEMSDVEAIAAATRSDLPSVLRSLKDYGLTGVAITEDTIGDLVRKGRLVLNAQGRYLEIEAVSDEGSRWLRPGTRDSRYIGFQYQPDLYHLDRAAKALSRRGFFQSGVLNVPSGVNYPTSISVSRDQSLDISVVPVGIDPRAAHDAKEAGLVVVARHFNEVGADLSIITRALADSRDAGASAYLVGGDQALGNRNLLVGVSEQLRGFDMHYLSPEFVTLGGDAFLRNELKERTIRLHSVTQQETETMSESGIEERLAKAFRERSVRWLLIRPTSRASSDPVMRMGETLVGVSAAIARAGGEVKAPRPFEPPAVSPLLMGAIPLLAFPAMLWALFRAFGFNWFSYVLGFVALALCSASMVGELRELAALTVAVAFPVISFLIISPINGPPGRRYPPLAYLLFSFVNLVGGLAVAGTLVGVEYTIRAQAFTGVKAALFLPMLVIGWLLLTRMGPLRKTLNRPVSWLAATVTIAGLVVIALVTLRSGNENPAAVSSFELQVRALLDNLLHVRPRTKEVVFGHPALILGLCLLAYRPWLRGWAALMLFAGMVGQTSIVNTMCHLHTPVLLSLQRIGVGLLLGGIIGLLVWVVARRWIPTEETAEEQWQSASS